MKRRLALATIIALFGTALVVSAQPVEDAAAADGSQFDPGYIISDALFYNGSAMSATDVQTFLGSKVSSCTGLCLLTYRQNTPSIAASSLCGAYSGAANERASDIIAKVGAACNISQKAILVLLEKEQGLITDRNADSWSLEHATGFGCPDTAPCDPAYAGFFYQIYNEARQFQNYAASPTRWNYQAGRVNNVLFHPDANRCSFAPVFIQNKATAGLYIYTPYQPNPAALANLYGYGDACSSYGNRNFWRMYTDWFGSPTEASSLVRTAGNATVYLISDSVKYPVPSLSILAALAPLGNVSFVSDAFLEKHTTGHVVGRTLRGPDGSIYFYDSGIKLPLSSCAQAVDYGASCAADGYVQLSEGQISAFATGPVLSSVLGTVEGSRYYIKNGTKAEILDDAAQTLAGIPLGMNVLSENAVAHLPLASPIVRDGAFVLTRSTAKYSLLSGGQRYTVSDAAGMGVPVRTTGTLSAASLALIPASATVFTGVVSSGAASASVLAADGRYDLQAGALSPSAGAVAVPQALIDTYPVKGVIKEASFIKSPSSATVFVVMPTDVRPVTSWDALLALTPTGNPVIITVPQSFIDLLAMGPDALVAGTLVVSPASATVYFINGVTNRIALSWFDFPYEAGFTKLTYTSEQRIQAYPLSAQNMTFGLSCGANNYVAAAGSAHLVDPSLAALYPFIYLPMDQFTCGQLKVGAPATAFIRTQDGTIYQLVGGEKRPIASMTRLAELGGTSWLNVVDRFASQYPTGPLA
jgi:hypothetical protein